MPSLLCRLEVEIEVEVLVDDGSVDALPVRCGQRGAPRGALHTPCRGRCRSQQRSCGRLCHHEAGLSSRDRRQGDCVPATEIKTVLQCTPQQAYSRWLFWI